MLFANDQKTNIFFFFKVDTSHNFFYNNNKFYLVFFLPFEIRHLPTVTLSF